MAADLQLRVDASEVEVAVRAIQASLARPETPKTFTDRVSCLLDDGGLDDCICIRGATSGADDHVVVLGVSGDLEVLAAAAQAGEFDGI